MPKGMGHGQKRGGGAQPGHQVIDAADLQIQLPTDAAHNHKDEQGKDAQSPDGACNVNPFAQQRLQSVEHAFYFFARSLL
jgi:hypothetical protein